MQNFADQCLDLAREILGQNLGSINADGTIEPFAGEPSRPDESGHAALALGEFYRVTQESTLGVGGDAIDLVDLAARCVTAQAFTEEEAENGLGYAALGLLSFGPAKERNPVWERLLEPTRENLDKRLFARSDYENHYQAFNVAKAVTRFSMGLSKKDETGKLIDKFIERSQQRGGLGFLDDNPTDGVGGVFDIYGLMSLVFIRQALQLHANVHLRERKLPSLRTMAEKYLKLLPDMVRSDGLGWSYGRGIGAYGQMHCISLILQTMRDGWISAEKKPEYIEMLRRLFQFFFLTFLDQENGLLLIRDYERDTQVQHTTRMANFDAVRYLCQWARLALAIGGEMEGKTSAHRTAGRWVVFDRSAKKEQGLFVYHDANTGLHLHLPLVNGEPERSDSLAFPHCPGVFDWPVNEFMPIMVPELVLDGVPVVPAFYGKRCVTGIGMRRSFYFRYEQPELISRDGKLLPNLGSAKVNWTFSGSELTSEFIFSVKKPVTCNSMRYMLAIGSPHSEKHVVPTFTLGEGGLGCAVEHDDFQARWLDTEVVSNEPQFKTYWGKLHFLQTYTRDHDLKMRPGMQYRLKVAFKPDVAMMEG